MQQDRRPQGKQYCKYCNIWVQNNKICLQNHETSPQHKRNRERKIREIQRKEHGSQALELRSARAIHERGPKQLVKPLLKRIKISKELADVHVVGLPPSMQPQIEGTVIPSQLPLNNNNHEQLKIAMEEDELVDFVIEEKKYPQKENKADIGVDKAEILADLDSLLQQPTVKKKRNYRKLAE